MRKLGLTAIAVLVIVATAAGQTVALDFGGGGNPFSWLRTPPKSDDDIQKLLDFKKKLDQLGGAAKAHSTRGEYVQAQKKYEELLDRTREVFTDDSPFVANVYGAVAAAASLAGDTDKTREYSKLAYDTSAKAFPPGNTFPGGREMLAIATSNYAAILDGLGKGEEAEKLNRSALDIFREVYGKDSDHPHVIRMLGNLAHWHFGRNSLDEAEKYAVEALERCTRLCNTPAALREHGEQMARSKNNMAEVLRARGKSAEAEALQKEATALSRVSPSTAPDALALRIRNEGMGHVDRRDYPTALAKFREAERMYEAVFPTRDYPIGHPDLLRVRHDIAVALDLSGKTEEAEPLHEKAVEMALALFPPERFPDGHVDLARVLGDAGANRLRRGRADEAARLFRFALDLWLPHIDRQASGLADADVLNLLDSVPGVLHGLLAAGADAPFDDRDYLYVWASKAGAMRVLDARRRADLMRGNSTTRLIAERLVDVRAKLDLELTRTGSTQAAVLSHERDQLQRQLADELKLPTLPRTFPAALRAKLPVNAAFIDYWKKINPLSGGGEYVAFVVTREGVVRVRLGAVDAVEGALAEWLQCVEGKVVDGRRVYTDDISERRAAEKMADLVWKPLAEQLPGGVERLFLSPDGDIARVPFAALPATSNRMVLDTFELSSVPHGPFLLDLLSRESGPPNSAGELLFVGEVDYGEPFTPWKALAFAPVEGKAVGEMWKRDKVKSLNAGRATVAGVLAALPKAGAAHFATHAVFDDPTAETAGSTRNTHISANSSPPLVVRSPLALTAMVLTGANRSAERRDGYLSGEAIAGLRLEGLRFVVLSACQSARGWSARGEGVFGFQRAFHLAGCPCVVGSLWEVSDPATAALMRRFYTHLAADGSVPAALRQAMKDVRDHPDKAKEGGEWTRGGADTATIVPGGVGPSTTGGTKNTIRFWAAFITSGW
jgi:CHAT domain-containing protein/tetratricopeptide (TPR) repeat protein